MLKAVLSIVGVLVVAAIVLIGGIGVLSETGGEVVVLHTVGADGASASTRLWVVDDAGHAWLRAGSADSGWLQRIQAHPEVEVERAGETKRFRAVPVQDPAQRDRIHALMAQEYGLADRVIALMRDGNGSIPIRLEPL